MNYKIYIYLPESTLKVGYMNRIVPADSQYTICMKFLKKFHGVIYYAYIITVEKNCKTMKKKGICQFPHGFFL